jgi:glycosyltransferase involved in cell wall biosynthesis
LSVVVPFYNEAPSLPVLIEEIHEALGDRTGGWEVVLVDDGSTDGYAEGLRALDRDVAARVRLVRFRRNLGKASALAAGFAEARGDVIVTMDADLQDDPALLPELLLPLDDGQDMVIGRKVPRRDPLTKRLASSVFNTVVRLSSGLRLHDINSGFKVMRREVVDGIDLYGEMHRLLPLLASWRGFRVTEVPVEHRPRRHGRSHYGLERAWRGLFDLTTVIFLTRYHKRPLHLLGGFASMLFGAGAVICLYLLAFWLGGGSLQERPLLFLGILLILLSGQVFTLGLLGEMITFATHTSDLSAYIESSRPLLADEDAEA